MTSGVSAKAQAYGEFRPLKYETVVADHAARAARNPDGFVITLLRSRSVQGRDILAHLATGGTRTSAQLLAQAEAGSIKSIGDDLDPELAGRLATVVALQGPEQDREGAVNLFAAVANHSGIEALRPRDRGIYLQLLSRARDHAPLRHYLDRAKIDGATRKAIEADLLNPFIYPELNSEVSRWLPGLARALEFTGTLKLGDGETPFDRLQAIAGRREASAAKVTVITSAYNPDAALLNAARSLMAQTWQNWEMLVVDDASTSPDAARILSEVAALDSRIRVIRKAVNGGTYRARNTALMLARGDFVTCLDSDDWAHPDRLWAGVVPMLRDPGIVATRSLGARVSADLEVTRPGYRTLFPAASSLMFPIRPVVERVGFFDPVRKGADTEYARRIEAAFGRRVVDVGSGALTVLRGLDDSLSASEFSFAWRHPVRWAYKQSYEVVHRSIRAGATPAFREPETPPSAFGIARWYKPADPGYRARERVDVVLAGDWRRYGGPQISMLEEIQALLSGGLSVGVLHLEAMRFYTGKDQPVCAPLRELLSEGRVRLIHLDDEVDIGVLLLRYPPILQFPPATQARVKARCLLIVANQAPAERSGVDQRYIPADVHENAANLFGVEPRWIPQSPAIRAVLEPLLPSDALGDWDNPAIIDVEAWVQERRRAPNREPVIGRFSRDDVIKFPRTGKELLEAYDFGPNTRVRMMGARSQVKRLLQPPDGPALEVPDTWEILPHKAMDVREFLATLDVVVYMDHPEAHEAFGRSLLESAASGALVVASPKHKVTFGDALLYAEPHEVVPMVRSYLADPTAMNAQVARTLQRVRERWGPEAFLGNIRRELATASSVPVSDRSHARHVGGRRNGEATVVAGQGHNGHPAARTTGSLRTITTPVRRMADGSLCDHLVIVHAAGNEAHASDAMHDLLAGHRPGTMPEDPGKLPQGIFGVLWYVDRRWIPYVDEKFDCEVVGNLVRVKGRLAHENDVEA